MVGFQTSARVEFGGGGGLDAYCASVTMGCIGCTGSGGGGVLIGACFDAILASTESRSRMPKLSPERFADAAAFVGSGEGTTGAVATGFGFAGALTGGGEVFAATGGS